MNKEILQNLKRLKKASLGLTIIGFFFFIKEPHNPLWWGTLMIPGVVYFIISIYLNEKKVRTKS